MKTLLSALFLALATPAVAVTVDPNGAFHTEDGVDLFVSDGYLSFVGDFPGNGFTLGGGELFMGLSTSGYGIWTGNAFVGDFEIMDDFGSVFLSGNFADLNFGDLSLSGLAQVTGGSAAALFGTTALISFFTPEMIAGNVTEYPDAVFQLEAAIPAPVPLPAALPLLLVGLGGLALMRRRRA